MFHFLILFLIFYFIFKSNELDKENKDSYFQLEETLKDIDA